MNDKVKEIEIKVTRKSIMHPPTFMNIFKCFFLDFNDFIINF